jgi:hypothetical protein
LGDILLLNSGWIKEAGNTKFNYAIWVTLVPISIVLISVAVLKVPSRPLASSPTGVTARGLEMILERLV